MKFQTKLKSLALALTALVMLATSASATTTVDMYDKNGYFPGVQTYFTAQGYTVNHIDDSFASLSGADLVIINLPSRVFTAAQKQAISSYVTGGGRLILNGDWDAVGVTAYVNQILLDLGATMRNSSGQFDTGFNTTHDIVTNPFTTGVHAITYALTSKIIGGTALVRGLSGQTFVGYEAVGAGYVFAIADADVAAPNVFSGDNARLYCNFGNLGCGAVAGVPEPSAWASMVLGLGVLGAALGRGRKRHPA